MPMLPWYFWASQVKELLTMLLESRFFGNIGKAGLIGRRKDARKGKQKQHILVVPIPLCEFLPVVTRSDEL